jgi:hypothetical protein
MSGSNGVSNAPVDVATWQDIAATQGVYNQAHDYHVEWHACLDELLPSLLAAANVSGGRLTTGSQANRNIVTN